VASPPRQQKLTSAADDVDDPAVGLQAPIIHAGQRLQNWLKFAWELLKFFFSYLYMSENLEKIDISAFSSMSSTETSQMQRFIGSRCSSHLLPMV